VNNSRSRSATSTALEYFNEVHADVAADLAGTGQQGAQQFLHCWTASLSSETMVIVPSPGTK
jgi:hypothetical protein